jgi:phosphoglycolate phosphatase
MPNIRGLLFDKDGTLFDFQATWGPWAADLMWDLASGDEALADALSDRVRLDRAAARFFPDSPVIAGTVDEAAATMLPSLPHMTHAALVDRIVQSSLDVAPVEAVPLAPLLRLLREAGMVLGVATNDAKLAATEQLGGLGLQDAFEVVIGADSGHGAKPGPGQCLAFAAHVGLDPAEIVMIGDSTHDLLAGRAAGMPTLGVLTGPASRAELTPHAQEVLVDIGHLPAWLGLA